MGRVLPFLFAALLALSACEGGNHYEPPAYSLGKCFWQPYLPNC
jgi:hypothetical protein